jgi:hypothetical protein
LTFSVTFAGEATKEVENQILEELRAIKKKYSQISYARFHGAHNGIIHFDKNGEMSQAQLDQARGK